MKTLLHALEMNNFITVTKGKLDDPVMQNWALHFYSNLPINAVTERAQIETEWFHEFFVAKLIDQGDVSLLSQLFSKLPPQHFSNLTNLIIKKRGDWSASIANSATEILAVNAPDELLELYKKDLVLLQKGKVDPLQFSSIELLFSESEKTAFTDFFIEFSQIVINLKDSFCQLILFRSIFELCHLLPKDLLLTLLNKTLQIEASDERRQHLFKSLFMGLFGHNEYLEMVFDREDFDSPLRVSALKLFFVDSIHLEQLDNWLINLPQLADVLTLLDVVSENVKGCRILMDLLQDSTGISEKNKTQLALAACIHGLTKETLDTSCFDLTTTVDLLASDLEYSQWNKLLIDHLKSFERAAVVKRLISCIPEGSDDYAAVHIAEAMGELEYFEFIAPLINAISDNRGDFLCDAAQKSLCKIGNAAQTALIEQWGKLDLSQKIYGLSVIRNIPGTVANDFSVNLFSELLEDDLEFACELFLASPDIRLVELLKPELRRKQRIIDRAFYILARLMDYDDPEVDLAKERALAEHLRCKNAQEAFETGSLAQSKYLSLELKCLSCDAVNQYETKGVILSVDANIPNLLADEFPCLSCGNDVEFQFTSMALMAITAELMKSTVHADTVHSQQSKVQKIECRIGGQVLALPKAISNINKSLVVQPGNALQWFQLANLISPINRPKAAIHAYQKALEFAPNAVDVKFALARTLADNQQETEAFQVMDDALKHLSKWTFLAEFSDFGHVFADLYNHLRGRIGKLYIPAVHPSALSRPKKIGRNDPCSCGSGKKYKKCCGR